MDSINARISRKRRVDKSPLCPQARLLFRISALLGLSPLVFVKTKSRFSFTLAFYSILILCFKVYMVYMEIYFALKVSNDESLVIIILMSIPIYAALQISSVTDAYFNPPGYGHIFEELTIIDAKLTAIGFPMTRRLDWSNRFLEIVMITVYVIMLNIIDAFSLFMFIGTASYSLISCQIISLGFHILSRQELAVHTLGQLKDRQQNIYNVIETLLSINHQLSRVANIFSTCYRLQLLVLSTFTFWFVTTRLYIIHSYARENSSITYVFLAILYFVIYYCVLFSRIIRCSSKITKKSQEFDKLLYQLMINDENYGLLENPKLKVHIAIKNNVIITACDFFKLDFSLILAMAASVSTYLVMLVQFGRPFNAETASPNFTTSPAPSY